MTQPPPFKKGGGGGEGRCRGVLGLLKDRGTTSGLTGGLQSQAEAAAARRTPKEAPQALVTHLAEASWLGS